MTRSMRGMPRHGRGNEFRALSASDMSGVCFHPKASSTGCNDVRLCESLRLLATAHNARTRVRVRSLTHADVRLGAVGSLLDHPLHPEAALSSHAMPSHKDAHARSANFLTEVPKCARPSKNKREQALPLRPAHTVQAHITHLASS